MVWRGSGTRGSLYRGLRIFEGRRFSLARCQVSEGADRWGLGGPLSGSGYPFRISGMKQQFIRVPGNGVCVSGSPGWRAMCLRPAGAGPPRRAAGGGRVHRGDRCLHWGFCFAQRGAVTWLGLQSFRGRRGELVGPRVILNGGRGSAGTGAARRPEGAFQGHPEPAQEAVSVAVQHPGTGLSFEGMYSARSWRVDPFRCIVGEIVGCSAVFFSLPQDPCRGVLASLLWEQE